MAAEDINSNLELYNTKIPALGDDADIQKAFIAYHYGDENFDRTETDPESLNQYSIAWYLNDLYEKFDAVSGTADIARTELKAPGDILGAFSSSTPAVISRPSLLDPANNGKVLMIDTSYNPAEIDGKVPGIQWKDLPVTLTNIAILSNKKLDRPQIVDNSTGTAVTGFLRDINDYSVLNFTAGSGTINSYLNISNFATPTSGTITDGPTLSVAGSPTNINLILLAKGSGTVRVGGTAATNTIATTGTAQTLTNKTIESITVNAKTLNFPMITTDGDTVVTESQSQTLTNKTLTNPKLSSTASGTTAGQLGYLSGVLTFGNGTTERTVVTTQGAQTLQDKTLTSPIFSGTVNLPSGATLSASPANSDNTTKIATTAWVLSNSISSNTFNAKGEIFVGTADNAFAALSAGSSGYVLTVDSTTATGLAWKPAQTSSDTNWYPTSYTWTGGTTSGPTGSLTGTGMAAVAFPAIPSAGSSASGIVTTSSQTFAGAKTFSGGISVSNGATITGTVSLPSTTTIGNVSSTELGYLDGATANIQGQINAITPLWYRRTTDFASAVTVGASYTNIFGTSPTLLPNSWYYCKFIVFGTNTWSSGNPYVIIQPSFTNTPQSFIGVYRSGSYTNTVTSSTLGIQASMNITSNGSVSIEFEGYINTNSSSGGTFVPQISLSGGGVAGFTPKTNSYIQLILLPTSNAAINGTWS